jgi:hypothetical protein
MATLVAAWPTRMTTWDAVEASTPPPRCLRSACPGSTSVGWVSPDTGAAYCRPGTRRTPTVGLSTTG